MFKKKLWKLKQINREFFYFLIKDKFFLKEWIFLKLEFWDIQNNF